MGGGGIVQRLRNEKEIDPDCNRNPLKLLATVAHDGHEASFCVSRGGGTSSGFNVSFGEAANFYHEVRYVTRVMTDRQRMALNFGQDAMADLLRSALKPDSVDFKVDQQTGDIFVVYQFREHAPFAVRMTPQQVNDSRQHLFEAARKSTN